MKGLKRKIITSKIYQKVCFVDYFLEDTSKDPNFIKNGCQIYRFKNHTMSFSAKTLKTKIKAAIPVVQSFEVFTKEEMKVLKMKNNDPRHLVLLYCRKEDKKVRNDKKCTMNNSSSIPNFLCTYISDFLSSIRNES